MKQEAERIWAYTTCLTIPSSLTIPMNRATNLVHIYGSSTLLSLFSFDFVFPGITLLINKFVAFSSYLIT